MLKNVSKATVSQYIDKYCGNFFHMLLAIDISLTFKYPHYFGLVFCLLKNDFRVKLTG